MTDEEKLEAIHQAILEAHRDIRKLHSTSALPGEIAPAIRTSIIAEILGREYDTKMYDRRPPLSNIERRLAYVSPDVETTDEPTPEAKD